MLFYKYIKYISWYWRIEIQKLSRYDNGKEKSYRLEGTLIVQIVVLLLNKILKKRNLLTF